MEYKKTVNLIDNTTYRPSIFATRNWIEINDESKGKYDKSNIRFKTLMLRLILCDYCDGYILVKRNMTVPNTTAAGATVNNTNKK